MSRWIVALALLVLVSKAATANYFVGNELHAFCQSDKLTRQHACIGYITGIADVLAEGNTVDCGIDTLSDWPVSGCVATVSE